MKKALKIGIGILGIGYAALEVFIAGNALPLNSALTRGNMDLVASITDNIILTYGRRSRLTKMIFDTATTSANIENSIKGDIRRYRIKL